MDENLAWLTQKTEESKCNKANFTFFSPKTVNFYINQYLHHFYINPTAPFQGYCPFLVKCLVPSPLKWLNFWKVLRLPPFNKGRGSNYGYLFIEVRKRTFFKFVAKKSHLKLILELTLIFFKNYILNYIMNFLCAVSKSPTWFFIYNFPLRTKFWRLQFLKHF